MNITPEMVLQRQAQIDTARKGVEATELSVALGVSADWNFDGTPDESVLLTQPITTYEAAMLALLIEKFDASDAHPGDGKLQFTQVMKWKLWFLAKGRVGFAESLEVIGL